MTPNPPAPNGQGELFPDPRGPLPPTGWATTSRAAAESMRGSPADHARARVLACITSRGARGTTIDEICRALEMGTGTVCPRVAELARPPEGPALIRDSGERRQTRSGRTAKVWVAMGARP